MDKIGYNLFLARTGQHDMAERHRLYGSQPVFSPITTPCHRSLFCSLLRIPYFESESTSQSFSVARLACSAAALLPPPFSETSPKNCSRELLKIDPTFTSHLPSLTKQPSFPFPLGSLFHHGGYA